VKKKNALSVMCLALLLAALLPASLSCGAEGSEGREIPFTRLEKGFSNYYAYEETGAQSTPPFFRIVTDQAGWDAFLAKMYPPYSSQAPSLPNPDFGTEIVIAAFQGVKPTGGYSIEVTSIKEEEGVVMVYLNVVEPRPSDVVSQAFTSPYDIVKVSRAGLGLTGEVEFSFWDNSGHHLAVEYATL
jgi:hypothetical protein